MYNAWAVILYLNSCLSGRDIFRGKDYWSISGADSYIRQFFYSQAHKKLIGKVLSLNQIVPIEMDFDINTELTELDFSKKME